MPQINCTHCGQTYEIPPEQWPLYQGRRITCTKCNQAFDVAASSAPAVPPPPPAPPAAMAQPAYAAYAPHPGAAPPKRGMSGGKIALLVCGILVAVLVVCGGGMTAILLPSLNRARDAAIRVKCAANLKQLGLAILMYQNGEVRTGALPDRVDLLAYVPSDPGRSAGFGLSGDVFVCPGDTKNTPSKATGQQLAADLRAGGHLSYVYCFENKPQKQRQIHGADVVLMYEPLDDHREGANFLMGDGSVDYHRKAAAEAMIKDLENGINPPSPASVAAGP